MTAVVGVRNYGFFFGGGGGLNEVGSGKLQYEVATPEVIKRENTALR